MQETNENNKRPLSETNNPAAFFKKRSINTEEHNPINPLRNKTGSLLNIFKKAVRTLNLDEILQIINHADFDPKLQIKNKKMIYNPEKEKYERLIVVESPLHMITDMNFHEKIVMSKGEIQRNFLDNDVDKLEDKLSEIVSSLIKKGAEVNNQDSKGNTALHNAAYQSHNKTASVLLKSSANPYIKNKSHETVFYLAIKNPIESRTDLVEELLKYPHLEITNEDLDDLEYDYNEETCYDLVKKISRYLIAQSKGKDKFGNRFVELINQQNAILKVQQETIIKQQRTINQLKEQNKNESFTNFLNTLELA